MELERAKKIFDDIKDLRIELLRDPASLGPDYLRENIALCRNYLNKVSYYLQEVMEETHLTSLHLDTLEAQFQVESDELLANDNRVKHLPAVEDRIAMINVILGTQAREIKRFKREIVNLKHVDKVIRHRKQELDNTMSTLRLQTSLLRDQLRSGLSYGDDTDARDDDRRRAVQGDDVNLDDLLDESAAELEGDSALVQNIDGASPEEETIVEDPSDPPADESEDEALQEVVEKPSAPAEDEEFSLFDGEDVDDLAAAAAKTKKTKKAKPSEKAPEKSAPGDFDDLDELIAGGGVDGAAPVAPLEKEAPAQDDGQLVKEGPNPLKSGDVDTDMLRFLDEDPGDALDALLADI